MSLTPDQNAADPGNGFYVVAREPGAEHPALPTWANEVDNPAALAADGLAPVSRRLIDEVPGAFQLFDVLSAAECARLIELSESLGYLPDAAVSLPRSIRHNHNLTWVTDGRTTDLLWSRCAALIDDPLNIHRGRRALDLNRRFRFYRYREGDYFKPHTDGAWPGSNVIERELISNAYEDRFSQLSFIIFLSDDYGGGNTQFYLSQERPGQPARMSEAAIRVNIRTPKGAVLCFPHGQHPLHCVHSSEAIEHGSKYIIRTDVLFEM